MDDRKEAGVSCVNHALNGVVPGWVVFGLLKGGGRALHTGEGYLLLRVSFSSRRYLESDTQQHQRDQKLGSFGSQKLGELL